MKHLILFVFSFFIVQLLQADVLIKVLDGYSHAPVFGAKIELLNLLDEVKEKVGFSDQNVLINCKKG